MRTCAAAETKSAYCAENRPYRLAARTSGSHPGNRSSILRRVTEILKPGLVPGFNILVQENRKTD